MIPISVWKAYMKGNIEMQYFRKFRYRGVTIKSISGSNT